MANVNPHISPEIIDVAWAAAQDSNDQKTTLFRLEEDEKVLKYIRYYANDLATRNIYVGINENQAAQQIATEKDKAEASFELSSKIAQLVMMLPNCPFVLQPEVEPLEVTLPQSLGELPAGYKENILIRYKEMHFSMGKHISASKGVKVDKITKDSQLPEIEEFSEQIITLAPIYERMRQRAWQPEVVFVPNGFNFNQWGRMLEGHRLTHLSQSKGSMRSWAEHESSITNTYRPEETSGVSWSMAIISANDEPVLMHVRPNGSSGKSTEIAIKELADFMNLKEQSPKIIKDLSPTLDMYFALQLSRLEHGDLPVDPSTSYTIARENITVAKWNRSLCYYWFPSGNKVCSNWINMDDVMHHGGVRPAVSYSDLVGIN